MKNKNIVIWDLDSTLIDTDSVFQEAQKKLIKNLSIPLETFNVKIDSEDENEIKTLRDTDYEGIKIRGHMGYDKPYQLPLSLLNIYLERSDSLAYRKAAWLSNTGLSIAEYEGNEYLKSLEKIPQKFDGIERVLEKSSDNYNLLFTEYYDSRERQYKKIHENNLEKYFDHIIMTEKKDSLSIMSTVEYAKLENNAKNVDALKIIYLDDRSEYLRIAKEAYPKCCTVNVLFKGKEIFNQIGSADIMIKNVADLEKLIERI